MRADRYIYELHEITYEAEQLFASATRDGINLPDEKFEAAITNLASSLSLQLEATRTRAMRDLRHFTRPSADKWHHELCEAFEFVNGLAIKALRSRSITNENE